MDWFSDSLFKLELKKSISVSLSISHVLFKVFAWILDLFIFFKCLWCAPRLHLKSTVKTIIFWNIITILKHCLPFKLLNILFNFQKTLLQFSVSHDTFCLIFLCKQCWFFFIITWIESYLFKNRDLGCSIIKFAVICKVCWIKVLISLLFISYYLQNLVKNIGMFSLN